MTEKILPEQTAIAEVLTELDLDLVALEQRRDKNRRAVGNGGES